MKAEKILSAVSRALMTGIFIGAGISKLRDREGTQQLMQSKNMPMIPTLYKAAVAMELGVAPAVLLGILPRFSALILSAFLLPTTAIFHNPFTEKDSAQRQMQILNALKNLAIAGGLISLALHDAENARRNAPVQSLIGGRAGYLDDDVIAAA